MEWSVEDTDTQREAEESCGPVHSVQLDVLPVGILRLIQTLHLCLWPSCLGEFYVTVLSVCTVVAILRIKMNELCVSLLIVCSYTVHDIV